MANSEAKAGSLVALKQKFQRQINCLSDENRQTRRRALDQLKRALLGGKPPDGAKPKVMAQFFSTCLQTPLLNLLGDPVEKCRELSCELVTCFAKAIVEDVPLLLRESVPMLKSRLGALPFVEPAEEMRLVLLQLLSTMLKRESCKEALPDLMEDVCLIIAVSLTDAFPDVKKECTSCVNLLSKASPTDIRSHAPPVVKALIGNVGHQHSKVRQYTLQALALLVPCIGAEGIANLMKDVMKKPLSKIVHDGSPTVRKEFIKMLTYWLRHIETVQQFHYDLLPMLLSGLGDDNPDIQNFALKNVEALGEEWAAAQPPGSYWVVH
jgi:dynein assembly factor 5